VKKKHYKNKNPELYVDGEKVTFHYNREERLSKAQKKIKSDNSFFSKKNRSLHIIIVNLIIIIIIGLIFSRFANRAISQDINGFKFFFFKKNYLDSPILDFRMQIKNISNNNNILSEDFRNMQFKIYDENENIFFSKEFYIPKNKFKPQEFHTEYIIVNKPEISGKYKAVIYFGSNKNLILNFKIK
jgi:hypothetical protein